MEFQHALQLVRRVDQRLDAGGMNAEADKLEFLDSGQVRGGGSDDALDGEGRDLTELFNFRIRSDTSFFTRMVAKQSENGETVAEERYNRL